MADQGFVGLVNNVLNKELIELQERVSSLEEETISARVTDIILDDTHPEFNNVGGWNGVGTIKFEIINFQTSNKNEKDIAIPLLPYLKNYPLVNEIVYLIKLPNSRIGNITSETSYYYLNSISIWNHPHHNAYPNPTTFTNLPESQEKDYQDIESGSVRRVQDFSTEIPLNSPEVGGTFIEKSNLHPILPFPGDIILEGRFGNSLRLGNTSKSKSTLYNNNWSGAGENGDPITILRNGQPQDVNNEGWTPIIENINKDLSSIYLTSTQSIPLTSSINSFPSISSEKPKEVNAYSGSQIILNSGRLVFNSYNDSIIAISDKSISLSSIQDMGIFSRESNVNISGNFVKLGSQTAEQSLVRGEVFLDKFKALLNQLIILMNSLESEPQLTSASMTQKGVKDEAKDIIKGIENQDYLSTTVKTL